MALAALLTACGDAPPPEQTAVAAVAARPANDFTAAVPVGSLGAAVRLEFQVKTRPVVGKPVAIVVRVTPTSAVQKIQILFEAEQGLTILDELRATLQLEGTAASTATPHELQVLPAAEGVLLLKATVVTDTERGAQSTEFAIPMVVTGAGSTPAVTPQGG